MVIANENDERLKHLKDVTFAALVEAQNDAIGVAASLVERWPRDLGPSRAALVAAIRGLAAREAAYKD